MKVIERWWNTLTGENRSTPVHCYFIHHISQIGWRDSSPDLQRDSPANSCLSHDSAKIINYLHYNFVKFVFEPHTGRKFTTIRKTSQLMLQGESYEVCNSTVWAKLSF